MTLTERPREGFDWTNEFHSALVVSIGVGAGLMF